MIFSQSLALLWPRGPLHCHGPAGCGALSVAFVSPVQLLTHVSTALLACSFFDLFAWALSIFFERSIKDESGASLATTVDGQGTGPLHRAGVKREAASKESKR
jgi:hypothetical protein